MQLLQILIWIVCLPTAATCGVFAYAGFGSRQPLVAIPSSMGVGLVLMIMLYMLDGASAVAS
jgi:hypothetical protein